MGKGAPKFISLIEESEKKDLLTQSGPHKLLMALLQDAIDIMYQFSLHPPSFPKQFRLYDDTLQWFRDMDGKYPYSCGYVLDHLGIEREALTRGIQEMNLRITQQERYLNRNQRIARRITHNHPYPGVHKRRRAPGDEKIWEARADYAHGRKKKSFTTPLEAWLWKQEVNGSL